MALDEPCLITPIRFATANPTIRVSAAGGTANIPISVAIDTDYWPSGDSDTTAGAKDLLRVIRDSLNTVMSGWGPTNSVLVTASSRNIITFTFDNSATIEWSHAGTTFDPTVVGFTEDDTGPAITHTSVDTSQGFWYPGTTSNSRHVRDDTRTEPVVQGAHMETIDGQSRGYELTSSLGERTIQLQYIEREKILTEYADASEPYGTLEYIWKPTDTVEDTDPSAVGMAKGPPVRWYDDKSTRTTSSYEKHRIKTRDRPWTRMDVSSLQRYEVLFAFREVS